MRAIRKPDRGRGAADFLHRDRVIEIAQPQSAPLLFDGDPVQTERAHRRPQLLREAVFAVDRGGERRNPLIGEAGSGLADHPGAFWQAEIEVWGGAHGFAPRGLLSGGLAERQANRQLACRSGRPGPQAGSKAIGSAVSPQVPVKPRQP